MQTHARTAGGREEVDEFDDYDETEEFLDEDDEEDEEEEEIEAWSLELIRNRISGASLGASDFWQHQFLYTKCSISGVNNTPHLAWLV